MQLSLSMAPVYQCLYNQLVQDKLGLIPHRLTLSHLLKPVINITLLLVAIVIHKLVISKHLELEVAQLIMYLAVLVLVQPEHVVMVAII